MPTGRTIICGDTHGRWGHLNTLINKEHPERVIVCGDFGYWRDDLTSRLTDLKPQDTKIHWCDGNHEHFPFLAERISDEVLPNVFYQPRGSTLTLPDGRVVMFFGGADSYDKNQRTLGFDWFKEELPTQEQLDAALAYNGRVDILVSHTAPEEFNVKASFEVRDPTRYVLSLLLEKYKPSLWYFGHWHRFLCGQYKNTRWICLHYADRGNSNWWIPLKDLIPPC